MLYIMCYVYLHCRWKWRFMNKGKCLGKYYTWSIWGNSLSNELEHWCFNQLHFVIFPQIVIAIGVLTSNRGEGDEPLWRIGRGTRVPLQGAVDVVPLLGAIVGCHCRVLRLGGRVQPTLGEGTWCHCWVSSQGAIVVCYGEIWGSGSGAIAGCPWHLTQQWHPEKTSCRPHCSLYW